MGKNIKSYATTQVHFPREREGGLTAKIPNLSFTNMVRLNRTHSLLYLQHNFSKFCLSVKVTANYTKFAQLAQISRTI